MSDQPKKINVPSDPVQIGTTPDGQPVHLDLKELIPTPDEEAERWDNTLSSRQKAHVDQIANQVIVNGHKLVLETLYNTGSRSMTDALEKDDLSAFREWVRSEGYEYIQDGVTTVVKKHGKVLRSMTANIQPMSWIPFVTARVKEIVERKVIALN